MYYDHNNRINVKKVNKKQQVFFVKLHHQCTFN